MTVWWQDTKTKTIIPQCSALFVDKLSITLAIPEHEKNEFLKYFKEIIGGNYGGSMYESTAYHFNKKVYDSGGESILFQAAPKQANNSFFRVAYNPSKIDFSELVLIFEVLLPGGINDLWKYGRVTRIDIATDVSRLPVHNLGFYYPGITLSDVKLKGYGIQTAYLGSKDSETQFVFYDKVAQLKYYNSKLPKSLKVDLPHHETTRVELRYRPKGFYFKELYTLENRFEKLCLSLLTNQPDKPSNDFEGLVRGVFELSKGIGLQGALYVVPKPSKEKVRKIIQSYSMTKWWKPDELWQTFTQGLDQVILGG